MYDDMDMHNWVTYHTNLENWIFKIQLIENRTVHKWEVQNLNNEFAWLSNE